MATSRRGRPVWVAVYVEKPRRKSLLPNSQHQHQHQQQQQQHHHHHLHLHQAKNACLRSGYNRKAQLLEYSRQLRESARSQSSSPLLQPVSHHHSQQLQPMTQMIPVQKKRKHSGSPSCLGNWKLLIPGFIRALLRSRHKKEKIKRKKHANPGATTTKIKALVKSFPFQVKKKGGFASRLFASRRKHR